MPYQIQPSESFDRAVASAKKTYYKKNAQGFERFIAVIQEFLLAIEQNGSKIVDAQMEPWPHGLATPGWDLSKYYFDMPALRGEAGEGRIIFATNTDLLLVYPVWFYTHKEFSKRPPDRELKARLHQAIADAQAQQKAANGERQA